MTLRLELALLCPLCNAKFDDETGGCSNFTCDKYISKLKPDPGPGDSGYEDYIHRTHAVFSNVSKIPYKILEEIKQLVLELRTICQCTDYEIEQAIKKFVESGRDKYSWIDFKDYYKHRR